MSLSLIKRCCALLVVVTCSTGILAASAPDSYGEMDEGAYRGVEKATYDVADFSDRFKASVEVAQGDDVFRPGIIRVYDNKGGAPLIEVKSDELVLDLKQGTDKVKANVHELPYGEQSLLMYEDFNFDGIKDLAIMDGQNSCYHGPSFQIFMGTANGFQHSESFTDLAQGWCGMFEVDKEKKQIQVMGKSGCCMHMVNTYGVINGELVLRSEMEYDQTGASGLPRETLTLYKDGTKTTTVQYEWDEQETKETLVAFKLSPSGKRIVLYRAGQGEEVFYAAVDGEGKVGLLYPDKEGEDFEYNPYAHSLSFRRGDTTYRILGNAKGVPTGMQVEVRGKATDLKLMPDSVEGSMNVLDKALGERRQ